MKNEAAAALGRLSQKKHPMSKRRMKELSKLGVQAREKKREEAQKNVSI